MPIPITKVFRKVRLQLEVVIAGATLAPSAAEADALERVRLALETVGALPNLIGKSSAVVQYGIQPPRQAATGAPANP